MKQLVIFDLDGTLLNSIGDLASATNYALEKLGFPTHPTESYYQFVCNGIMKLFERALPADARTPENLQKMRELFLPYYDEHGAEHSFPYDGIMEVLKSLQARGIKLAVASNKHHQGTEKLVRHFFSDITFSSVYGQREGFPMKPDPLLVQQMIQTAQVTPENTLYVGDSAVDMQTANNAKVDSCAVLWGFRSLEELTPEHPTHIVKQPVEILRIV